jgi:TP901 family phage tail tape measure protein
MGKVYDLLIRARGETADAEAAMKQLQKAVGDTGRKMTSIGKKMTLGVTVPVIAAGAASFKAFANFDQTMRQVGAVADVSGKQLDDMRSTALKLGKQTSFSAQEVSTAMLELSKGGISQAQMSAGVLKETLTLAAAGGLELGESATYMTNTLNAFGLKAGSAGAVAAALAGGANASTASVQSLGMGLAQVSTQAGMAGMTMNETIAALAAFDAAGVKGSDAGTSLKTMLQRLVPQTDRAKDAMKDLGLKFTDANGSFLPMRDIAEQLQTKLAGLSEAQRTTALNTIFGSDASRAAGIMAKLGAEGIDKMSGATKDLGAAQELAKTNTSGASGSIEQMMGSINTLAITLGATLAPTVIAVAQHITSLANDIAGLDPVIQHIIVSVALFAASLGPVLIVVGQMTTGAAALAPAFIKVGGALSSAATAAGISTAAMAPLLTAITLLAAGVAVFVEHERNKANAMRDASAAASEQIAQLGSLADAQNRIAGAQLSAKEASLSLQQAIVARDLAEKQHGKSSLEYRSAVLAVSRAFITKKDAISQAAKVEDEEGTKVNRAAAVAHIAMQKLIDEVAIRKHVSDLKKQVRDADTLDEKHALQEQGSTATKLLKQLENAHVSSLEATKLAYKKGLITRKEIIAAGLADEVGIVTNSAPKMRAAGKKVGDAAAAGARSGKAGARQAGKDITDGMESGILSGVGGLMSAAAKVVRDAIAAGKREADAHSPSRRTAREIGAPFSQGIAVGIASEIGTIERSARGAVKAGVSAGAKAIGFRGTGFNGFGDLSNKVTPTGASGLANVVKYVTASSGDAYTTTQNDDGTATVSENTDVTAFLRQRKAASEARVKSLLSARKTQVGKLAAARKALALANAALGKAKMSGDKKKLAAAQKSVTAKRDAVGSIQGLIEGYEQEILQLGGQVEADAKALEEPDVSGQNADAEARNSEAVADASADAARVAENLRREALGLQSLDEEEHLAAINQIRVANGLNPVSSVSEIGGVSGATNQPLTQQSIPQQLLPTSESAIGALRDAITHALRGAGATVNVNPQSGDPEAIANRVAMILGSSMLMQGGTI